MKYNTLPLLIIGASAVLGQELTPRELFYTPAPRVAKANVPTPTPKKKPATSQPKPSTETSSTRPAPVSFTPLGLRYSLLHSADGTSYGEVDADTVFHSGDKLRVAVQSNDPAYLYVIVRGSSGNWKVMFPSADLGSGDNKVETMKGYELPPGGRFYFDENAGEEKLFIVLSRKPVANLESLMYDLAKPTKDAAPEKKLLLAERIAPINDALVGSLRAGVQSRDLVFEKVDEKTAGERKEKAVYIVNKKATSDARLVVDLTLKHK